MNNVYSGWTESDAHALERLEHKQAEHDRIMKEREEAKASSNLGEE